MKNESKIYWKFKFYKSKSNKEEKQFECICKVKNIYDFSCHSNYTKC
jgi:hypothetical protein